MGDVNKYLRALVEHPSSRCPSFDEFFVDEYGLKAAARKDAEPKEGSFTILLYAMSKRPLTLDSLGFPPEEIDKHCPSLIMQLGRHIESIVQTMRSSVVGEIERVRGMHGREVVHSAEVTALWDSASFEKAEDIYVTDGIVSIGFAIRVPTEVGEFRYAYP